MDKLERAKQRIALLKARKKSADETAQQSTHSTPATTTSTPTTTATTTTTATRPKLQLGKMSLNITTTTTKTTNANKSAFFAAQDASLVKHKVPKQRLHLDFLDRPVVSVLSKSTATQHQSTLPDSVDPLDAFMDQVHQLDEASTRASNTLMDFDSDSEQQPTTTKNNIDTFALNDPESAKAKKKELALVDHSRIEYEPFRKNFYIESPEISRMSNKQVELLRLELDNIKIRGTRPPKPILKWTQCGLPIHCLQVIQHVLGFDKPTPIQSQAIPAIMQGRDVIGVAKTGSGKTMAFLLPLFRHIKDQRACTGMHGPIGIIMTPTRELAMQTYDECRRFTKSMGIRVNCVYGGAPIKDHIADMKRGGEVLVCTPGRLIDLLLANAGRVTHLRRCTYLVLDEGDRMFDMGFEQQVMRIIANVRPDAQRVLFSATFPRQMEALARKILNKPLEIIVGSRSVVCADVQQHVEIMNEDQKFFRLLEILGRWAAAAAAAAAARDGSGSDGMDPRLIIFVERQETADHLLKDLFRKGYRCLSLHGGKDQMDRDSTISDFKSGACPILIATSVAARGLDVKELNVVINYDCPNHMEDYVHRVGRTGRAGRKGTAYTFITHGQEKYSADIYQALKMSQAPIPRELERMKQVFLEKVERGEASLPGSGFGGKGLEQIEKERELIKGIQKKTYGEQDSDEEEDDTADMGKAQDSSHGPGGQPTASSSGAATGLGTAAPMSDEKTAAQLAAIQRARDITKRLGVMKPPVDDVTQLMDLLHAQLRGDTHPGSSTGYTAILEVNDYPQKARARLGAKELIAQITEMYRVSMTMRGEWVPPGRNPQSGEKKLHLVLDGPDRQNVEQAKEDLKRMLADASQEAMSQDPRMRLSSKP